ncbi:copper resistance CopC family protein [Luethyella okanaganae]|uniref:Copper resistance protein CopC n=1 Tax=Luethyella okanaganae TaxID=69372 RepID=A0ABW1VJ26_9MICO
MRRATHPFLVGAVIGAVVSAAVAGLALGAAPVSAHNYPVETVPADGEIVTEQPGVFSLTTNDVLLEGGASAMEISGPSSAPKFYGDGCATVLGPKLEAEAQLGEPGEYTVTWQVVSADGHPISGSYSFDWQPTAGIVLAEGRATAPACGGGTASVTTPAPGGDGSGSGAVGLETSEAVLGDIAWVASALGAVLLAVLATLLILRRRSAPGSGAADSVDAGADESSGGPGSGGSGSDDVSGKPDPGPDRAP